MAKIAMTTDTKSITRSRTLRDRVTLSSQRGDLVLLLVFRPNNLMKVVEMRRMMGNRLLSAGRAIGSGRNRCAERNHDTLENTSQQLPSEWAKK